MMYLNETFPVAATTADLFYIPAPCRGIVKSVKAVYSQETDEDETVSLMRGATTVNLATPPADATAEGVSFEGVPDSTNKDLVFDPASTTAANRVIRVSVPNTFDTAGILCLVIGFDPYATIPETPTLA